MKIKKPRITYLAFLECELRGKWQHHEDDLIDIDAQLHPAEQGNYSAMTKGCELWLVQPNDTRRAFVFKRNTDIQIKGTTVKFDQDDVIEELSIDEKTQLK